MPLLTMASAADLTRSSVTLQAKRFQLFHPMGGVSARPFSRARAGGTQERNPKKRDSARQCAFFMRASLNTFRLILVSILSRPAGRTTRARLERALRALRADESRRREMLLRCGDCRFCGGFRSVDDDGFLAAFGGGGVNRTQIDAFRRELVQALSQRTRFVRQLVLFRESFLIRDPGGVESFLGAARIFHDELNRAACTLRSSQERENVHLGVPQGSRDCGDCPRLIVDSDCELLGFCHVSTSCCAGGGLYAAGMRDEKIKKQGSRPRLRRCSAAAGGLERAPLTGRGYIC